jgi:hypothetical protein
VSCCAPLGSVWKRAGFAEVEQREGGRRDGTVTATTSEEIKSGVDSALIGSVLMCVACSVIPCWTGRCVAGRQSQQAVKAAVHGKTQKSKHTQWTESGCYSYSKICGIVSSVFCSKVSSTLSLPPNHSHFTPKIDFKFKTQSTRTTCNFPHNTKQGCAFRAANIFPSYSHQLPPHSNIQLLPFSLISRD